MKHALAFALVVGVLGACRSASSAPSTTQAGRSYVIEGQVMRSGPQPIEEDVTLFEAVTAAQPLSSTCDLAHVRVTRTAKNPPLELVLDLNKMMRAGDSSDNILIQPGDVIVVPARQE